MVLYPFYGDKLGKMKSFGRKTIHTLANWSGIWIVPGSIDLATNNPLSPVVVSGVTYKHHYSIILVLGSIYQSPSPVFHSWVANIGTSHRWKGQRSKKVRDIWQSLVSFANKTAQETQKSAAKGKEYSRTHLGGASGRLHLPDSWHITELVTDPARRKPGLHWYAALAPKEKSWPTILPLTGGNGIPQDMTMKKKIHIVSHIYFNNHLCMQKIKLSLGFLGKQIPRGRTDVE